MKNKCAICNVDVKKKELHKCGKCNKKLCAEHAFIYVDGNNIAITMNGKEYCEECYREKYRGLK